MPDVFRSVGYCEPGGGYATGPSRALPVFDADWNHHRRGSGQLANQRYWRAFEESTFSHKSRTRQTQLAAPLVRHDKVL